jgi:hypothetical protein
MRYHIWMTLVMCGTLIVLAPPISDYLAGYQLQKILSERKDIGNVNFGLGTVGPMSENYRFGCWALGAAMIAVAVVGGSRESDRGPDVHE